MAQWQCEKCGHEKEGRCKPRKCPECGESGSFTKKEGTSGKNCSCSCNDK